MRSKILDWVAHRREVGRWNDLSKKAPVLPLAGLRQERARARKLRSSLNEMIAVADNRLALPMIGSRAFPRPHGTDWSWRPQVWRNPLGQPGLASVESNTKLGSEVTLFHDCQRSELSLRQLRNHREADLAPYGLRMDVFNFDGSFLSLVLDMPQDMITGLSRKHLIRLDTIVEMEKPLEIFARLNIKHGPNTEQMVRELPLHEDDVMVEFDLAYSDINERRIEKVWVDIIFENPEMSQVTLRDVTFARRPRTEL